MFDCFPEFIKSNTIQLNVFVKFTNVFVWYVPRELMEIDYEYRDYIERTYTSKRLVQISFLCLFVIAYNIFPISFFVCRGLRLRVNSIIMYYYGRSEEGDHQLQETFVAYRYFALHAEK